MDPTAGRFCCPKAETAFMIAPNHVRVLDPRSRKIQSVKMNTLISICLLVAQSALRTRCLIIFFKTRSALVLCRCAYTNEPSNTNSCVIPVGITQSEMGIRKREYSREDHPRCVVQQPWQWYKTSQIPCRKPYLPDVVRTALLGLACRLTHCYWLTRDEFDSNFKPRPALPGTPAIDQTIVQFGGIRKGVTPSGMVNLIPNFTGMNGGKIHWVVTCFGYKAVACRLRYS